MDRIRFDPDREGRHSYVLCANGFVYNRISSEAGAVLYKAYDGGKVMTYEELKDIGIVKESDEDVL